MSAYWDPHEVPVLLGDASKAKEKLGWEPKYTMEDLAMDMYRSDWWTQEKILRSQFGLPDPMSYPNK